PADHVRGSGDLGVALAVAEAVAARLALLALAGSAGARAGRVGVGVAIQVVPLAVRVVVPAAEARLDVRGAAPPSPDEGVRRTSGVRTPPGELAAERRPAVGGGATSV